MKSSDILKEIKRIAKEVLPKAAPERGMRLMRIPTGTC